MKILLVITHGNIGGATNVVYELAHGLKKNGEDVTIGFSEGAYLENKLRSAGIAIHHFQHLNRTHNPLSLILFINEIRHYAAAEHFDAVQFNSSNTLPGALGVKLANKTMRTIFTIHGLSMLSKNHEASAWVKWIYYIFFKLFFSFVDIPVFVSEHDFLEAKQTGLTQKGMVIHNGIDISALRFLPRTEARKALGETIGRDLGSAFVVGSIGRLSHEKNYGFLIKTFPDVLKIKKDAVLVVIGDGPEHKEYEDAALALGIKEKVFLPGEIPGAPHYLAAFDVFVLPSRYEGLPITLVECLFAGTPVIASDVGGNREIAPAASLYGFDDKAKFLDVFSRAAKDPAAFVPHRTSADAFTGDAMAKEYLELFHG